MKITVTQDDINQGCRAVAENCPVARAVIRATGIPYAWVCTVFIAVYATEEDRDDTEHYQTRSLKYWRPQEDVANRIRLYDATGHMSPFEFEL